MSGHTHEGWHNTGPGEAGEAALGGGHLPERAGSLPGVAPRSYDLGVGSGRLRGLGCEQSPVLTPLISVTPDRLVHSDFLNKIHL